MRLITILGSVFTAATVLLAAGEPPVTRIEFFRVPSSAMEPLIERRTVISAELLADPPTKVERGKVVLFRYPYSPDTIMVKRVVAVGGDTVEIKDKNLYVNGLTVSESFVVHRDHRTFSIDEPSPRRGLRDQLSPLQVPEGNVFLLGDNRDKSVDSRIFGPVPLSEIVGFLLEVAVEPPPDTQIGLTA